ncbi:unnamed protein product [Ilex paraguariensis]|uniref:BHLH domain-containing protein n=1 Tax=Ilex paraguariensis TaxID=185542 RepID=A0ABC8SK12_9AQUA
MEQNPSSSRADRKTIEKNRRTHMKTLFSQLNSLLPHQTSREALSLADQLDEAANHIKNLQANLVKMKQKKDRLVGIQNQFTRMSCQTMAGARSPQIEVHEVGLAMEVVLITGLDCQFIFTETIRMIHEEGAEVVNASFFVIDNTVFHTIHSKVGESAPGYGCARISERLKKFVYGANSF